jgi:hypothetical protein
MPSMQTEEIARHAWNQWLDEFTAIHEGWLVSIEIVGPEIGAQPEIDNLPLLGVSPDRIDHDPAIVVAVGRSSTDYVTHVVRNATHLHIQRTDQGADAALQIESSDGVKTILRFRTAALPETVDGVPKW